MVSRERAEAGHGDAKLLEHARLVESARTLPLDQQMRRLARQNGLPPVILGPSAASDMFISLDQDYIRYSSQQKEDPGHAALSEALSDEEKSRLRFGHSWRVTREWSTLGERWGRGLSLYYRLLPPAVKRSWKAIFSRWPLQAFATSSGLSLFLKAVGDTFKKLGELASPHWRFFVNLETLGGYRLPLPIDSQIEELRNWATGDIAHCSPPQPGAAPTEDAFLADFRAGVRSFLDAAPHGSVAKVAPLTIDEFVADPGALFSTGSTSQKSRKLRFHCDGVDGVVPSSKSSALATLSASQIAAMLRSYAPQVNSPIQKVETGKVRAVVRSDDHLYYQMTYLSHYLEAVFLGHRMTTLYMRESQRYNMWARLAQQTTGHFVCMPLDQSHFDWQVNFRMLHVVCDELGGFIRSHCSGQPLSDMLHVLDLVRRELTDGSGVIEVDSAQGIIRIPISKGVMSGWRWTAMLDTIINVGELYAARQIVIRATRRDPVASFVAQGDDDQVTLRSAADAVLLYDAYELMGFEVNPHKFFVDTYRDEFLRQVPYRGQVVGYPARSINSILWRNPTVSDPPAGVESLRATYGQWNLAASRGLSPRVAYAFAMRDISSRLNIAIRYVDAFCHTPVGLGGLGTRPYTTTPVQIVTHKDQKRWVVTSPTPVADGWRSVLANYNLPETIADKVVRSRLTPPRVTFGSVETRVIGPLDCAGRRDFRPARIPLKEFKLTDAVFPRSLHEELVHFWIRQRDYVSLLRFADPECLPSVGRAHRNMSAGLFTDWLTHKLEGGPPVIWGAGPESVAHWYNHVRDVALSSLLSGQGRAGRRLWRSCLLAVEDATYTIVGMATHMSG